jgi:hypothetical protein
MNKRLGFALAAYLAIWTSVAAGIVYGIVQVGYPAWVAVISAFLLFVFVNGSLAYRARARQLRLEGKEPPPYFKFLFFPQGFPKFKEQAPKFDHVLVGIAATITGLFFLFCGAGLAFGADWSRMSQPMLVASICLVLAGIGAVFLYLAWRAFAFTRMPPRNVA